MSAGDATPARAYAGRPDSDASVPGASVPGAPVRTLGVLLFLAALIFQLTWFSGRLYSWDDVIHIETARAIVERGELSVPDSPEARDFARPGRDGRLYSKFGFGMTLVLAPFYAAGRPFGPEAAIIASCLANPVLIALLAPLFALTALQLGARQRDASIGALVLTCATPVAAYGRALFNDPLVAVALLAAFRSALRREPLACGLALALAALTRAEYVVAIPAFFLFTPPRQWPRLALPLAVAGLFMLGYNAMRFGNPLDQGQLGHDPYDTFSTPLVTGLYGLILSPGKGVLWYCPPILLGLMGWWSMRGAHARAAGLALLAVVPMIILHALWHSWMGGWSYGPRRLVALLPLLMLGAPFALRALSPRRAGRIAAATVIVLGFLMQLGGLIVDFMHYIAWANERQASTLWSFGHSAALGHWRYLAATGELDLWYVNVFGPSPAAVLAFLLLAATFIALARRSSPGT